MIRLNRILLCLLVILVLLASVGFVASDEGGSGSLVSGGDSGGVSSDDGSADGSLNSYEDVEEDPLDVEYYDSDDDGDSFSVSLSKHATSNPLLLLFLALISIGGLRVKF